jgi:hypothetical protein
MHLRQLTKYTIGQTWILKSLFWINNNSLMGKIIIKVYLNCHIIKDNSRRAKYNFYMILESQMVVTSTSWIVCNIYSFNRYLLVIY